MTSVEGIVITSSNVVTITPPPHFDFIEQSLELFLGEIPVPLQFDHELLRDSQFRTLGDPEGVWHTSPGVTGEHSFFAFPAEMSARYNLSGDLAHLSGSSDSHLLRLWQRVAARRGSIIALARTTNAAHLSARLIDNAGVLREQNATAVGDASWHALELTFGDGRPVAGELIFEIEVSGEGARSVQVALADSRKVSIPIEPAMAGLVVNSKLEHWPNGVGVHEHSVGGEITTGWRLISKGCAAPVATRAIQHAHDGAFGLALAAPQVGEWLRIEADLNAPAELLGSLLVSFRAGVPAVAAKLFADHGSSLLQFAQIDRLSLICRSVVEEFGSFEVRERLLAPAIQQIPVGTEVVSHAFPVALDVERGFDELPDRTTDTYHLVFEFRRPVAIALFDVQVEHHLTITSKAAPPRLALEDSTIELQVPKVVGLNTWVSDSAVSEAAAKAHDPPLKWSVVASREPVEIIIPVFNALEQTLACVESVGRSSTVPTLVRLIDDGSDASVREVLESYTREKPWVELHSLGANRGYTFAADFGMRSAQTEWVVLLNSDTIVTTGWLEGLLACARRDPQVAFVGPLSNAAGFQSVPELYSASGKWKVNALPPGVTPNKMSELVRAVSSKSYPEVPLLNGFCTLIRRSAFLDLGGFNIEAFQAGYGEETDLCLRAGKAGYKLAVADDVYVYHVKSASFGAARREELTKAGKSALRNIHPDVDMGALTKQFRDTLPLVTIRDRLAQKLSFGTAWP